MCFKRPTQQATEPQAKGVMRSILCHSLVVELMFEQSENVAIIQVVEQLLTCIEGCGL